MCFLSLFVVMVLLMIILSRQGKPLQTPAAKSGIGSFEFAWTKARAQQILASWQGLYDVARVQLTWDFGFLLLYPLVLSLACGLLAQAAQNRLPEIGSFLSWSVLAAGWLDAAENLCLLRMLKTEATDLLVRTASTCASIKFLLIFAGCGYVLVQGAAIVIAKWEGP